MYSSRPNLYIGFHGCDETVRNKLINNPGDIRPSREIFDWLGNGFYVWENNHDRALKWAKDKKKRTNNKNFKPSVLGVVYQLNYCLDLTDSQFIDILPDYYDAMKEDLIFLGEPLPKNKNVPKDEFQDLVLRELDCAVIEYMHQNIENSREAEIAANGYSEKQPFDSARGVFTEGGPAFEGAGIQAKNHIQVCIRNLNCIKGFFIPRTKVKFP